MSVLRNFSDINNNILFKPGKSIATMSTMKNIMAKADVAEEFESEFGVYDLPEFLRALDSFAKPVFSTFPKLYVLFTNWNRIRFSRLLEF